MVETAAAQVIQRAEGVEAGEQRHGQAPAGAVEPQRRRPRQDPDAVPWPDRVPVLDALDVVPHPVRVDHGPAGSLGDADHPAVDVRRHPGEHPLRRAAEPLRPRGAHQLVVSADPARRDDHRLGRELELACGVTVRRHAARRRVRREDGAADAGDGAVGDHEVVDPVPEPRLDPSGRQVRADPALERRDDARAGAPGDVEARHRVARAGGGVPAALGPADHREQPQALLAQPRALLAGGEVDVGLRPAPRPVVLLAVEPGRALPVLPGQLGGVLDAHPALLGRVDEEQPAERPPGLTAEVGLALLVEQQHPAAGVRGLGCGDQPGQTGSHHDDVGVHAATLGRADRAACTRPRPGVGAFSLAWARHRRGRGRGRRR